MSAIHTKSLTGITSITTPPGVDNVFTVHSNDTTERFRVDLNGNQSIAGILTVSQDLDVDGHTNLDNVSVAGVTTFTGNPTIYNADPQLTFRDSNHSPFYYYLKGRAGAFVIEDSVNGDRLSFNSNSSISVTASMFQISGASNIIGNLSTGGTLTLPDSIIHTGDTDTKIRFPSNDTVTAETGGSERLRIDSLGNVSIGGIAPVPTSTSYYSASLHIHQQSNNSTSGAQVHLTTANKGSAAGDGAQISQYNGNLYINNQDDGNMYFLNNSNSTIRMTITSGGALGFAGANYGSSGQVLTSQGSSSAPTWTTISGTTINNNAANRVITGSGTANTLNGESSVIIDSNGKLLLGGVTGTGNASVYARDIFISGNSNRGITIHTTDTSGVNRKCCLFFGTGTSVADMADGMLFYDHAGQYMHLSVNGAGTGITKASIRLHGDGTVRFDSTPTTTNSISLLLKSHKARSVNDNNGILFKDASDHSQAAIYVQKKSTSDASSDLVFATSSGQVVATLQGIPERMRINQDGIITNPYQASFYATANSGGTVSMTSTHTLTNWRLSTSGKTFDIGSNFNTSNGRFTAPVTGKYLFTASILLAGYDQASDIHMMWRKNGTTMQYWYNTRTSNIDRSGYGGYLAQGSTTTFSLSANDYIDIACVFSGTLSLWCGDANWGHFSGHLLG